MNGGNFPNHVPKWRDPLWQDDDRHGDENGDR
jgi:hypothetical protein